MEQDGNPKIAAVCATFNRKAMVLRWIECLINQSKRLYKIIVVVNGNVDGTYEAIMDKFGSDERLVTVVLEENFGNPYGLSVAINEALEDGADWIWILDDDAWPRPDALEKLISYGLNENCVYASLLIDPTREDMPFPTVVMSENKQKLAESVSDLPSDSAFEVRGAWLGSLISKEVISKVGELEVELFIRGEDEEYPARIRRHGYKFLCVKDSIIEHPSQRLVKLRILGKNFFYEPNLPLWKSYYLLRNKIYIQRKYEKFIPATVKGIVTTIFFIALGIMLDGSKIRRTIICLKAWWHGTTKKLGKKIEP